MECQLSVPAAREIDLDDERELVERAKRDKNAFAQLYRSHYRTIAAYVFRRTGHRHTTEDIVADVFMIALQTLPRYRCRGLPIRAWLYRIATNSVNRWARRQRRRAPARLDAGVADETRQPDPTDSTQRRTRAALLTLPPKLQAVLALHYFEDMPLDDIARTVGCRLGTVKSRLARGRETLRERLLQRRSHE